MWLRSKEIEPVVEILVMKAVNAENDKHAKAVQTKLRSAHTLMLNLLSGPGAGKTRLLEETLSQLPPEVCCAAIEGDLFTDEDARRLERFGIPVIQLNTEGSCHLTAAMIEAALEKIPLAGLDFLFVENVGNLVCPSSFFLGEQVRVTLLSVTEGNDKIRKYPKAFQTADCLILSKIDLLPFVQFSLAQAEEDYRRIHAGGLVLALSTQSGEGFQQWLEQLLLWRNQHSA
jgi:hydrogenase nickel incorporation protein HypB